MSWALALNCPLKTFEPRNYRGNTCPVTLDGADKRGPKPRPKSPNRDGDDCRT